MLYSILRIYYSHTDTDYILLVIACFRNFSIMRQGIYMYKYHTADKILSDTLKHVLLLYFWCVFSVLIVIHESFKSTTQITISMKQKNLLVLKMTLFHIYLVVCVYFRQYYRGRRKCYFKCLAYLYEVGNPVHKARNRALHILKTRRD